FPDTFTQYYQPAVGMAALQVLRHLWERYLLGLPQGWRPAPTQTAPRPWDLRCCGRPLISNGMLKQAVVSARHNVERLYPWAAQGNPIIACEPSCILTIQDDYPALLHGEVRRKAETVAQACQTVEQFLDARQRAPSASGLQLLSSGPAKV